LRLKAGCQDDIHGGELLHRLNIEWKYTAATIAEAISPKKLLDNYGIFHPRSSGALIREYEFVVRAADITARHLQRELTVCVSHAGCGRLATLEPHAQDCAVVLG
jgi:TfoX/Sxy family transcriptional regulator of competence genes